jgi:SNF2 family DNA or RNA helicase
MDGERELTTGLLAKDASFRLIVSGRIGEKEIERLIRKLELDKEILSDTVSGEDDKQRG